MKALIACIVLAVGTAVAQESGDTGTDPLAELLIARQYAADIAECGTTMIVEEAARQSIPIMELFARFFAAQRAGLSYEEEGEATRQKMFPNEP